MFAIIHGEDKVKSRHELQRIASGHADVVTLDGKHISLETIIQNVESASLFGENSRLTIIENLHRLKSKTELKEIVSYLASLTVLEISLILWEGQDLTKAQLNKFPAAQVIFCKTSPIIFALTDSVSPDVLPAKRISLCREACLENAPEMILVMLARHLRLMISTYDPNSIWPPNMLWQKTKLAKIAQKFSLNRLIDLHHQLALIDSQSKTGTLAGNLDSKLKVWIATIA